MINRVILSLIFTTFFLQASLLDFIDLSKFYELYNKKNYKEALVYLKKLDKDTPEINYNIANTLYKLERYNEAIKYYKRANGGDVDEFNRVYNIANAYFKLEDYEKAIFSYEAILKYKKDEDAIYNLELAYKRKLEKLKEQKKSKKDTKKREGKGKKDDNKESKKLTKEELEMLKKLKKQEEFKKELKSMLKTNLKDKKVPVLLYRDGDFDGKLDDNLKPW